MASTSSTLTATVLGSGTSHGVPMIGCDCKTCKSSDYRDRRMRPSLFVQLGDVHLLIDTSPELRLQCLANDVSDISGVLYTHHHADHVAGLDDLRRFNWLTHQPVACYGSQRTLSSIKRMFSYVFESAPDSPHSRPKLELCEIGEEPFEVCGTEVIPIPLMHGPLPVLGYRLGNLAYCTDCSAIPEASLAKLGGLDVLVLDALRHTPHATHFNLEQAVEMASRIGAHQTYFTHIAHEILHDPTDKNLPSGMALAYDGLIIHSS